MKKITALFIATMLTASVTGCSSASSAAAGDHLKKIQDAVRDIRYGTVTLVIQDGRLIQIDRSEKIRLKSE